MRGIRELTYGNAIDFRIFASEGFPAPFQQGDLILAINSKGLHFIQETTKFQQSFEFSKIASADVFEREELDLVIRDKQTIRLKLITAEAREIISIVHIHLDDLKEISECRENHCPPMNINDVPFASNSIMKTDSAKTVDEEISSEGHAQHSSGHSNSDKASIQTTGTDPLRMRSRNRLNSNDAAQFKAVNRRTRSLSPSSFLHMHYVQDKTVCPFIQQNKDIFQAIGQCR